MFCLSQAGSGPRATFGKGSDGLEFAPWNDLVALIGCRSRTVPIPGLFITLRRWHGAELRSHRMFSNYDRHKSPVHHFLTLASRGAALLHFLSIQN